VFRVTDRCSAFVCESGGRKWVGGVFVLRPVDGVQTYGRVAKIG